MNTYPQERLVLLNKYLQYITLSLNTKVNLSNVSIEGNLYRLLMTILSPIRVADNKSKNYLILEGEASCV